jgi:hypothetical protein
MRATVERASNADPQSSLKSPLREAAGASVNDMNFSEAMLPPLLKEATCRAFHFDNLAEL